MSHVLQTYRRVFFSFIGDIHIDVSRFILLLYLLLEFLTTRTTLYFALVMSSGTSCFLNLFKVMCAARRIGSYTPAISTITTTTHRHRRVNIQHTNLLKQISQRIRRALNHSLTRSPSHSFVRSLTRSSTQVCYACSFSTLIFCQVLLVPLSFFCVVKTNFFHCL